ncbi:MAG: hypothetical protein ABSB74_18760 [Tepidisphaeraceae bacterium]
MGKNVESQNSVSDTGTTSFFFREQLAFCRGMNKPRLPRPEELRQIIDEQRASGLQSVTDDATIPLASARTQGNTVHRSVPRVVASATSTNLVRAAFCFFMSTHLPA